MDTVGTFACTHTHICEDVYELEHQAPSQDTLLSLALVSFVLSMSLFEILFCAAAWVYSVVSGTSKFLWLKINRWFDHTYMTREASHNIVVIGDSLAERFGDWVTSGKNAGITWRLKRGIQEDENIVLPWKVSNCGHFAATSDEWNPMALKPPKYMAWTVFWKSLFSRVFDGSSGTAKSDIVIIILGSFDCRRSKEGREVKYTSDNLHAITEELVKRGKYVIVCQLLDIRFPDEKEGEQRFMGRHQFKNQCMYHSKTGLVAEFPGKVFVGANLTHVQYTRHRILDNIHLNTYGYELLYKELLPIVKKAVYRVQLDVAANLDKEGKKGK